MRSSRKNTRNRVRVFEKRSPYEEDMAFGSFELNLKFKQNKIIKNRAQWARADKHPPRPPRSTGLSTWATHVNRAVDSPVDRGVDLVEPSQPGWPGRCVVEFLWSAWSLGLGGGFLLVSLSNEWLRSNLATSMVLINS